MEEIVQKKKCTGCTTCANSCPQNAISMEIDENGFNYPIINKNLCIKCEICKKSCPIINSKSNDSIKLCYVGYNKNEESLKNRASSGGIFELVAEYVLSEKGIVIGAAFNKEKKLIHTAIEKKNDLLQLKGSKYLQSDLGNIFKYVEKNIADRVILFVGTPCQVAGIKKYIGNNKNLICIDLFCHGVPSPKLFNKYIKELESEYNEHVLDYNFRDKSTGWDNYSNTIKFEHKIQTQYRIDNPYMKLFLSDVALRESCYNCNFKLGNKYSDITLGDFWGVKKFYPEFYNYNGTSAIIINTEKGLEIFNKINTNIQYKECTLENIISGNTGLKYSPKFNNKREIFFKEIDYYSIELLAKKYGNDNLILNKLKKIIKQIIR